MRKSKMWNCCLVLLVSVSVCGGEEDWSRCPKECKCKWISGKRTADCQGAGLRSLPKFPMADKIQVLHLDNNPIGQLTDVAFVSAGLINIQKAYLSNCSLTNVHPGAFSDLVILIELNLSNNMLRTIHPGTFVGNIRLRKLWMTSNPLRSLHGFQFPALPHLRILDLSHGRLVKMNKQTFANLEHLEILHLNHNRFRRLDKRVFVPASSLKSLTLDGNPWHCDCRLQDFWQWLMFNNLFNSPTECATPPKLKGYGWDKLSSAALACAPVVHVPEPMVAVATGQTATLACLVNENPNAKMQWVRSGVIIRNNTHASADEGGKFQRYTIHSGRADLESIIPISGSSHGRRLIDKTMIYEAEESYGGDTHARKIWFNLTILNVQMSGSGGYTCVAKNEGGVSEANVTLVYSESVATYLDNRDISMLLVTGLVAGVLVFLAISSAIVCWVMQRKQQYRLQHQTLRLASTTSVADSRPIDDQSATVLNNITEEEGNRKESNGKVLFQHNNVPREAQCTKPKNPNCFNETKNVSLSKLGFSGHQQQLENKQEHLNLELEDSGCGSTSGISANNLFGDEMRVFPDLVHSSKVASHSPGWTSSSMGSDCTLVPEQRDFTVKGRQHYGYGPTENYFPYYFEDPRVIPFGWNAAGILFDNRHPLVEMGHGQAYAVHEPNGGIATLPRNVKTPHNVSEMMIATKNDVSHVPSSQVGYFPTDHLELDVFKSAFKGGRPPLAQNICHSQLEQTRPPMPSSRSCHEQQGKSPDPSSDGSLPSPNSSMLWSQILARRRETSMKGGESGGTSKLLMLHKNPPAIVTRNMGKCKQQLESIREVVSSVFEEEDNIGQSNKKPDFTTITNPSMLAQEMESRNEMLHALVKDKNDTPV